MSGGSANTMSLYVVMLGPPGSGKGTQAQRLTEHFGIPHISTGDMFRAIQDEETELARQVRDIMRRGELVPDALTIEMVRSRLQRPDAAAGAIFDGFPRTIAQADALAALLQEFFGEEVDVALLLDVDEEEIMRRVRGRARLEGRADDAEEIVRKRHQTYLEQTTPLVDYYRARGKLVTVDGARPIADITQDLVAVLREHA